MPVRQEISEGRVPVKVYTDEIEPQARQQLVNISRLPIVHHHVAAMPDVLATQNPPPQNPPATPPPGTAPVQPTGGSAQEGQGRGRGQVQDSEPG